MVGEPEALAHEAAALGRIGEHRAFPRVVDRDDDPGGSFLALSAPSTAARMLADVVQNRTVEETVAAIARTRAAGDPGAVTTSETFKQISAAHKEALCVVGQSSN